MHGLEDCSLHMQHLTTLKKNSSEKSVTERRTSSFSHLRTEKSDSTVWNLEILKKGRPRMNKDLDIQKRCLQCPTLRQNLLLQGRKIEIHNSIKQHINMACHACSTIRRTCN